MLLNAHPQKARESPSLEPRTEGESSRQLSFGPSGGRRRAQELVNAAAQRVLCVWSQAPAALIRSSALISAPRSTVVAPTQMALESSAGWESPLEEY